MTRYPFKLPDIGEGIAEAEIVAWHVAVGDTVAEDAPLADMMTDKATVEITAPVSGRVMEIAGQVGDMIPIGAVLALLEVEEENGSTGSGSVASPPHLNPELAPEPQSEFNSQPDLPSRIMSDKPAEVSASNVTPPALTAAHPPGAHAAVAEAHVRRVRVAASPTVRKRAADLKIDLSEVACASGDRVRHGDLDAFLSYNADFRSAAPRRPDEEHRVIGLRRRIAENMAAAKRHIPHFTYVEEIDVTKLEAMREDLNANRGERPRLTVLPLLIIGVCKAVAEFPMLNARYDDQAAVVTRSGAVHLGIATQTDSGLMVPVIRDAQDRNIWQLASEIRRLSEAARGGKATSSELSGSTLTITSLGPLGGLSTTPVINRPEVAIIGPNRIVERPVLDGGEVKAAKLMNLSISCDHRVVDGWDAAKFVQRLKAYLETPAALFVG
ncbi:dihydrolipoamide acetyltransferase family protein [Sphingomonas sp. CCH18-H6]|uniref:dihydrolipoamide acetyltransferase family protein n=1 Tax=Sphingomonas sp. CCH18-H6 TaxID=1768787 RepID=UPI00082D5468|nr:dihydrolipoamide acetyltransferase family protein [Sphingomonas sp. CCH18-H6]